ncbi:hypothetical protein [Polaromonas glacialis]|uniref:hypothetical protein n=1 Tax=Polaromonas glacialis TaxID=866564 RepID=UPI0012EB4A31|nr:hypothetical protein [Polaromonas glacialis]
MTNQIDFEKIIIDGLNNISDADIDEYQLDGGTFEVYEKVSGDVYFHSEKLRSKGWLAKHFPLLADALNPKHDHGDAMVIACRTVHTYDCMLGPKEFKKDLLQDLPKPLAELSRTNVRRVFEDQELYKVLISDYLKSR